MRLRTASWSSAVQNKCEYFVSLAPYFGPRVKDPALLKHIAEARVT